MVVSNIFGDTGTLREEAIGLNHWLLRLRCIPEELWAVVDDLEK